MLSKYFTKAMSALLILGMIGLFSTGCGTKTATNGSNQPESSQPGSVAGSLQGDSAFPISKEQITIKILKPLVTYDTDYSKMPVLQDFEKKSNIHIEWNTPSATDFNDKYSLIMASGELPDAIIAMPSDDIEKYGQQGVLVTLNDILDKEMPNLQKVLSQYPQAKKVITGTDGKIYSMPFVYRKCYGNDVPIIREDWLHKLNLQMPVTTDDWFNVLKAFKEGDPNENGKQDELPYSGDGVFDLTSFVMAWGIGFRDSTDFYGFYAAEKLYPKDNKIHFGPVETRYKEALQYVNKLFTEGLVDPEVLTNDGKAFQAKMTQDLVGSSRGYFGGDLTSMNETAHKNGMNDFHLVVAPVIKGPYGDQYHTITDVPALPNGFAITKSNKYPVETARWADYWYSEEGQKSMLGVEGKSYTDTNGELKFTDWVLKNPEGKTSNEAWGSLTPGRSIWPSVWIPISANLQFDSQEVRDAKQNILTSEYLAEPLPSRMSFSQADNDQRKQVMADITTYVNESVINFIIGKKSFSEWDQYVDTVKSMGIDEITAIYQKAYSEWQSK